ncbi:MAG: preprotein translocase subunit YajC [Micromonosporaceae bacterium]
MLIAADQGSGGSSFGLIMIVLLIGAMYFLMIRPQSKRRREAMQMQATLASGDEVMTGGGIFATVTAVEDDAVLLEVAPGVTMRFARGAIARVMPRESEPTEPPADNTDAQKTIEQA